MPTEAKQKKQEVIQPAAAAPAAEEPQAPEIPGLAKRGLLLAFLACGDFGPKRKGHRKKKEKKKERKKKAKEKKKAKRKGKRKRKSFLLVVIGDEVLSRRGGCRLPAASVVAAGGVIGSCGDQSCARRERGRGRGC